MSKDISPNMFNAISAKLPIFIIKMWYGNSRSHMKIKHTFKAIFDKWITNREDLTNSKTDYKTVVMKIPWYSAWNRRQNLEIDLVIFWDFLYEKSDISSQLIKKSTISKIVPGLLVNQIIETKVNSYFTLFRKWSSGIIYMCITKGMAKQIVIPYYGYKAVLLVTQTALLVSK